MDPHADRRDAKRDKARRGMRVVGASTRGIPAIIAKRDALKGAK